MTLTVEPKLVKLPRFAWLLWLASLVSVLGTLAFIAANNGAPQQRIAYGQALADNLALLAREPFVAQDKIQLGLLSKRIAQLPHVAAVTIVDVNEQVLANLGAAPIGANQAAQLTQIANAPVRIDNNLVGYVRIRLLADAFAQMPSWRHTLFGLLLALVVPAVLLAARRWRLQRGQRSPVVAVEFTKDETQGGVDQALPEFLIAANLFHRLGLNSAQQSQAQEQALAWAEQIAPLYGGRAQAVEQAAVIICIPDTGQEDGAFAALCAGLLWSRCLTQASGYRLGAHVLTPTTGPAQSAQANHSPAARNLESAAENLAEHDALLLAAIAGNGKLSLSAALLEQIQRPERIQLQAVQAALHEDLTTVGDGLYQVQGVAHHYEALLSQQAQSLSRKRSAGPAA